jgi:hypothetical protein
MFQSDFALDFLNWQSWEEHLHVPLDRWVVRLLSTKYLGIGSQDYESDFLTSKGDVNYYNLNLTRQPYIQLQGELAEVSQKSGEPRIVLDGLWFVGYFFCSVRPFLCSSCWIKENCSSNSAFPNLERMQPKSKPELKKEQQEKHKQEQKFIRQWVATHPKEVEELKKKLGLPPGSE